MRLTAFPIAAVLCWAVALAPAARAADAAPQTGSGTAATEARAITDFRAIAVSGSIDLVVRQTGREAVEVRADDNLLPLLETVVESGTNGRTLLVRWKRGLNIRAKVDPVVRIEVKDLVALSGAGSGDIKVDTLKTTVLKVSLSGSGDLGMTGLAAEDLAVSLAGSGDVQAAGTATRLRLSLAGSGDLSFGDMQSDEVNVSIAGSGDASVVANKALSVSIAGSGDVVYSGNPPALKASVAGSGTVRKR